MNDPDNYPTGKLISSTSVFQRYRYDVRAEIHEFSNNKFDFTIIHAPDWSLIVPVTEDEKFIMIRQYRPGWRTTSLEFPAGRFEDHEENSIEVAKRELKEETGYEAANMVELTSGRPVTWATQTAHFYLATDLTRGTQELDDTEDIMVEKVDPNSFLDLWKIGKIVELDALLAYFLWVNHQDFLE